MRDTQQELTQHVSTRLVQQDAGLAEKFAKLRAEVDELPKKVDQGVKAVKMESAKIGAVMRGTVEQMSGMLKDTEYRLHACERKVVALQELPAQLKAMDASLMQV